MPQNVAVLFVHGIFANDFEYALSMQRKIIRALPRKLRTFARFKSIFWADIVRGRSQLFLHLAQSLTRMVDSPYRRFVVEGLGDAAAYQKTRSRENSAYYQIQERITQALKDADSIDDPTRPLVFVGHSLGCHIISSYAWDINRLKQMSDEELRGWNDPVVTYFVEELRAATPFRRLGTFAGFVSLGNNMPLFTFMFGPDKVYPITKFPDNAKYPAFPGVDLPSHLFQESRWLNFYSPNDLLGYPLKPLNNAYKHDVRLEDREVWSEGFFRAHLLPSRFNALQAHMGYWTNPTVIKATAQLIARLITAEGPGTLADGQGRP